LISLCQFLFPWWRDISGLTREGRPPRLPERGGRQNDPFRGTIPNRQRETSYDKKCDRLKKVDGSKMEELRGNGRRALGFSLRAPCWLATPLRDILKCQIFNIKSDFTCRYCIFMFSCNLIRLVILKMKRYLILSYLMMIY